MNPWEPIILSEITVGSLVLAAIAGYVMGARDERIIQQRRDLRQREIWTAARREEHRRRQELEADLRAEMEEDPPSKPYRR